MECGCIFAQLKLNIAALRSPPPAKSISKTFKVNYSYSIAYNANDQHFKNRIHTTRKTGNNKTLRKNSRKAIEKYQHQKDMRAHSIK